MLEATRAKLENDPNSPVARLVSLAASLADQGAQSVTTLVTLVALARSLKTEDFGAFSIVLVMLTVSWAMWRALVVEPFVVAFARDPNTGGLETFTLILRRLLTVIMPLATAAIVSAALTSGIWSHSLAFVAGALLALAPLEAVRVVNLVANNRIRLLGGGVVWLVLSVTATLGLLIINASYVALMGAYVGAVALTAMAGLATLAPGPVRSSSEPLKAPPWKAGFSLALEYGLAAISTNALVFLVAAESDLVESAGLRGAMLIAGPITTLLGGLRLGLLADASRRVTMANTAGTWVRYQFRMNVAMLGIAGAMGLLLIVLAELIGSNALGDSWEVTQTAYRPFMLGAVLTAMHLVAGSILKARGFFKQNLYARIAGLPLILIPEWIGASQSGASGAAWGLCIGVALSSPLWIFAATKNWGPRVQDSPLPSETLA